jgi:hypothetical protein
MAIRGTDFVLWVVPTTGTTILSVLSGEVDVTGCGGHQANASTDESVRVAGDCSGAAKIAGRAVPGDSGIDGGGSDTSGTNARAQQQGRDRPSGGGLDGGDGGGDGDGDSDGDSDGGDGDSDGGDNN